MTDAVGPRDFRYGVFGLELRAPFTCPELDASCTVARAEHDGITVRWGSVPAMLDDASLHGACFARNERRWLLRIPGVAAFLVEDGRRITVDVAPATADETVRALLFDSVLAAALQQRGFSTFAGCAVAARTGVVLVLERAGTFGCAALAARLLARGHGIVADPFVALAGAVSGALGVLPGPRSLLVCADVLAEVGLRGQDAAGVPGTPFRRVPLAALSSGSEVLRPTRVFVLTPALREAVVEVDDARRAPHLWRCLHHPLASARDHLPDVRALARRCPLTLLEADGVAWHSTPLLDALERALEA